MDEAVSTQPQFSQVQDGNGERSAGHGSNGGLKINPTWQKIREYELMGYYQYVIIRNVHRR